MKENDETLNMTPELLEIFRANIRYTSRTKFQEMDKNYPQFKEIYNEYLKSAKFQRLVNIIKKKYDDVYLKLFFRHSINFLNFNLKEKDLNEENKVKKKSMPLKLKRKRSENKESELELE